MGMLEAINRPGGRTPFGIPTLNSVGLLISSAIVIALQWPSKSIETESWRLSINHTVNPRGDCWLMESAAIVWLRANIGASGQRLFAVTT